MSNPSPRMPRPATLSDDMDYEDKHMFPPSRRSHLGSPIFSRRSVHSVSSSVESSPAAPASAKSYTHSPMKTRHSESELLVSPRNRSELDEYPRYEPKKKMSADFSDDTMSVGSIGGGGESPKSDKGSWRLRSAVSGPFLTGPLAKDFQTEHLKTPRGKAREDMNFDHSGLLFPLAPVLDAIPDTPRGGYNQQPQGFTDISQYENSSEPMDGFHLDQYGHASTEPPRQAGAFNASHRAPNAQSQEAMLNSQYYAGYAGQGVAQGGYDQSLQQPADGYQYDGASQSSAIVATQSSNAHAHAPSYADVVVRNGGASSEQSLVSSTASDSLESLSKGMADSMAQILAKTQNGRSYGEVQLTTLVQKIHLHMNIMGRTSAAIREDYNRIKTKLEQTITDKKVLEATNYHLQQLVQQYEVERQYFHQYVLHSLQSQSSLIYESMGNLSQNVSQSKHTIEELSARLSRELSNIQGSRGSDSQLKEVLEEIKRAVDASVVNGAQQQSGNAQPHSPARTPQSGASKSGGETKSGEAKSSGFKLTPVLIAALLWIATLAGVYFSAKSAALSELQQQPASSILPSDLDLIVDQISQKLESAAQASEVRKLVYTELKQNPQIAESVVGSAGSEIAGEIPERLDEEVKAEHAEHSIAPGAAIPSEPSASVADKEVEVVAEEKVVGSTEVTSDVEVQPESAKEEEPPAKSEDKSTEPVVPAAEVDSAVPSDAVPPALDAVVKPDSSIVEIEVPPVDAHQQTYDEMLAKMLHLNGFPGSESASDDVPAAVDEAASQPPADVIDVTKLDVPADKSAESEVESASATEDSTQSPLDSQARDEAAAEVVEAEAEVVAPVVEIESARGEAPEDVVEVTIDDAVNPDLVIQKEQSLERNTTSVLEPASLEESTSPVEPSVVSEGDAAVSPSRTAEVEPVIVETVSEPAEASAAVKDEGDVSDAKRDAEVAVEPVEVSLAADQVVSSVSEEAVEKEGAPVDEIEAERREKEPALDDKDSIQSQQASVEVSRAPATDADSEASLDNASFSGEAPSKVTEEPSKTADLSVPAEQVETSTSFAGLSMALRSLASRFVDGLDSSKEAEVIHPSALATDVLSSSGAAIVAEVEEPVDFKSVKHIEEDAAKPESDDKAFASVGGTGEKSEVEVPVVAEPVAVESEGEIASRVVEVADAAADGSASESSTVEVGAEVDVANTESVAGTSKEANGVTDVAKDSSEEARAPVSSLPEQLVEETDAEVKPTDPASTDAQSKQAAEIDESADRADASNVESKVAEQTATEEPGKSTASSGAISNALDSAATSSLLDASSVHTADEATLGEVAGASRQLAEAVENAAVASSASEATGASAAAPLAVQTVDEVAKESSTGKQLKEAADSVTVATSLDTDVLTDAGVEAEDSLATTVAPVESTASMPAEGSVVVDGVNGDEAGVQAKESAEQRLEEAELLQKLDLVITEAIDVEGNIGSPAAELELTTAAEKESVPAKDAELVALNKETPGDDESKVSPVAIGEPVDASSLEEASAGEGERGSDPATVAGAALTADSSSSVVAVPAVADSDNPADSDAPSSKDGEAFVDIESSSDAIGSVDATDSSQPKSTIEAESATTSDETTGSVSALEQIKSGSSDVKDAGAVEGADSTRVDADSLLDVEASKMSFEAAEVSGEAADEEVAEESSVDSTSKTDVSSSSDDVVPVAAGGDESVIAGSASDSAAW